MFLCFAHTNAQTFFDLNALAGDASNSVRSAISPICFCPQLLPHPALFSEPKVGMLDAKKNFKLNIRQKIGNGLRCCALLRLALANCCSEVVQCRFSCEGSSSAAAIISIASWKEGSINEPAFSAIRISSSFLEMDGDSPKWKLVQFRNTSRYYSTNILRYSFLIFHCTNVLACKLMYSDRRAFR